MKNTLTFLSVAIVAVFLFTNFKTNTSSVEVNSTKSELEIPENINTILQKSCYGCHNTNSRGEKSKAKLNLDELTSLPKPKLVSKLNKMAKVLNEGKMPPEKFLAKFPEKEPTKEEKQALIDWASASATALMEE